MALNEIAIVDSLSPKKEPELPICPDTDYNIFCKFCLDELSDDSNKLIRPCNCKGSLQYVH